jgi:hypothetical protein
MTKNYVCAFGLNEVWTWVIKEFLEIIVFKSVGKREINRVMKEFDCVTNSDII